MPLMYQINMSNGLPDGSVTIPSTWGNWNVNSNASNFTATPYKEYLIKGEMLTVKYSLSKEQYETMGPDYVKSKMALMMAEQLVEKHIEFTRFADSSTFE